LPSDVACGVGSFQDWHARNRARTRAIFDLITDEVYYSRPIDLRHPIVFYEGHLAAFSVNTLVKRALGKPGIDARLEALFARGIDPSEEHGSPSSSTWPDRKEVRQFVEEADRQVSTTLLRDDLDRPGDPMLNRSEAVFAILEHEQMHQETLLYMWHQLPFEVKRRPQAYTPLVGGKEPDQEWVGIPPGRAILGTRGDTLPFAWDNERPAQIANVSAFDLQRHNITNAAYLEFVDAGGYDDARFWDAENWAWVRSTAMRCPVFWEWMDDTWYWRGMFERIQLPLSWPVYVSHAEASAYARWCGLRLPAEAEFQRAAFATPDGTERTHPWGDAEPTSAHGVFDFSSWDPEPAGSHPAGRSAWGVDDLVGNGWEWTSSVFAPFPRFQPLPSYPEYSADFFDGEHFVMKGASPATARELLRPTFRNWFRPRYPYVYATFRCAR
jgi:ergothioneine biosynthesis protein EgtB